MLEGAHPGLILIDMSSISPVTARKVAAAAAEKGAEMIDFFGGKQPRLAVMAYNNSHNSDHYGNIVTYLRIKGLVPPSSEGR